MTRLLALLAVALAASPASASDRPPAAEACLAAAPAGRCYVALEDGRTREVASDGVLARPPRSPETYDRQGNAVDRRGRILAVPANGDRAAEVFIDD